MATRELIIDSFAGGGGASLGIQWALGRGPDVAINHEPTAIAMHRANHPRTEHLTEDVFKTHPREVTKGKPVGLLWASPDCTHHSRAKGGTPVKKEIRGLAWVIIKWAGTVKPRVIILENVVEFADWGPVCPRWRCPDCKWKGTTGQAKLARRRKARCPKCDSAAVHATEELVPNPAKKGVTFKQWVGRLKALGYAVEWKTLNAADYGAPTHRRRLFLVARRDKKPIVWPEPTHGDPAKIGKGLFDDDRKPWRTAAECIDWSLPCPSIFMTKAQAKRWAKENGCAAPKRPLQPNTMKRIALGIRRFVLENPRPFIVVNTTGSAPTGTDEPLKTVTTGNHHYLVTPTVIRTDMPRSNAGCAYPPEEPFRTITSGGGFGVVSPLLVPVTHAGERRANSPGEPLPTVTGAHRGEFAVVAPFLAHLAHGSGADGRSRGARSQSALAPTNTIHAGGGNHAVVAAFLTKHFGGVVGHGLERPIGTVTAVDHHSVTVANLVHLKNNTGATGLDAPTHTVLANGNHAALVYSFLTKYHGSGGQWSDLNAPAPTVVCNDSLGLVTVTIDGHRYAIVDIGMRMVQPHELFRAQGFPDEYVKSGSKGVLVELCGNSVSPCVAKAVAGVNVPELAERTVAA